jgi:hypothetical protein
MDSKLDTTDSSNKEDSVEENAEDGEDSGNCARVGSATRSSAEEDPDEQAEIRRRRELNRLSKIRCRKRRNELIKSLQADVSRLAAEYHFLRTENEQLRQEFLQCCVVHGQGQIDQIGLSLTQNQLNLNSISAGHFLQNGSFTFSPQWANQQHENLAANTPLSIVGTAFSDLSAAQGYAGTGAAAGYSSTAAVQEQSRSDAVPANLSNGINHGYWGVGIAAVQERLGGDSAAGNLNNGVNSVFWGVGNDLGLHPEENEKKRKADP